MPEGYDMSKFVIPGCLFLPYSPPAFYWKEKQWIYDMYLLLSGPLLDGDEGVDVGEGGSSDSEYSARKPRSGENDE